MVLIALDKLTDLARKFKTLQNVGSTYMDLSAEEFVNLTETCEALWAVVRASALYRAHSSVDCIVSCDCEDALDKAFETVREALE